MCVRVCVVGWRGRGGEWVGEGDGGHKTLKRLEGCEHSLVTWTVVGARDQKGV